MGILSGLFVAEGSSDLPLAETVEALLLDRDVTIRISAPDYSLLGERVAKDVRSRIDAGLQLVAEEVDLIVVHRDADRAGASARREEIMGAARDVSPKSLVLPLVPVRMTEAWLLLDETAIRLVAGNPRGRVTLPLPKPGEVERRADPKGLLSECILIAADVAGRRRERVQARFDEHRRQLLERLDPTGPVSTLISWRQMIVDLDQIAPVLVDRAGGQTM